MSIDKYYVLVTEGVTDCSLLEAIIEKYMGYNSFERVKDLPPLFEAMIGKYPTTSGELKRQDSPTFYYKDNIGIAIKQANGYSQIPIKIGSLLENIDKLDVYEEFAGFLVFCDTDLKTKEEAKEIFVKEFSENQISFEDGHLITCDNNRVKCNLYFFPNTGEGAIEKLLLECAQISYSRLFSDAMEYKDKIMEVDYEELRKECWATDEQIQEFYSEKVQFGAISTVLKPDRPVRFTIKDKIIRKCFFEDYMNITEFKQLYEFLGRTLI